jgi:uncharacterized protein YdhG (YjbR/CyaY superfamily)
MRKKSPTTGEPERVDAYIAAFPAKVQQILNKIRRIVRKAAPEAHETIAYRIPTFVLGKNLVHFAAFEQHVGLYPTPSAMEHFAPRFAGFKTAKGSVQFPLDQPIPYDLIQEIVEFRVSEARGAKAT